MGSPSGESLFVFHVLGYSESVFGEHGEILKNSVGGRALALLYIMKIILGYKIYYIKYNVCYTV